MPGIVGHIAGGYNKVNDTLTEGNAMTSSPVEANSFLNNWINVKLPEVITGLAMRVVDDGSGTIAKEVMDAGKGEGFLGSLLK